MRAGDDESGALQNRLRLLQKEALFVRKHQLLLFHQPIRAEWTTRCLRLHGYLPLRSALPAHDIVRGLLRPPTEPYRRPNLKQVEQK